MFPLNIRFIPRTVPFSKRPPPARQPPPFTPPSLHAGSHYQAEAMCPLTLIRGGQPVLWTLSRPTHPSPLGKPQLTSSPTHTEWHGIRRPSACHSILFISTWLINSHDQLKLEFGDLLTHSTFKTEAAGSLVEINANLTGSVRYATSPSAWQPASHPTNNCTAKSQPPQKNIFNTFNYEIWFSSQTSARNCKCFFFFPENYFFLGLCCVVICLPAAKAHVSCCLEAEVSQREKISLKDFFTSCITVSLLCIGLTVNHKAELLNIQACSTSLMPPYSPTKGRYSFLEVFSPWKYSEKEAKLQPTSTPHQWQWFEWEWPHAFMCIWTCGFQLVELFGKEWEVWPC